MEKLNELIKDIEAVDNMYLDKKNVLKALKIAKKEITKQLPIQRVSNSLPSSEYLWVMARSESDRRIFIKWFEQYRQ